MKSLLSVSAAFLAVVTLAACSQGPDLPPPSFATSTGPGLENAYRLQIGDKLKLTVFGEDNLSGDLEVNGRGELPLPLIGEIPAKGRTVKEVQSAIAARLADGYIKSPRVNLEIRNYRPIYVHGEVKSGGQFQFSNSLSFTDAIAMAGGYTYRAQQDYVILSRAGTPPVRIEMSTSMPILPGDNIRVPERFF
ncbi:MAG: polysaccharide export protein [Alphaproteobacteria bacterium]|nr:polysaccharide export protein [Alphaproteobacteria bacterium]